LTLPACSLQIIAHSLEEPLTYPVASPLAHEASSILLAFGEEFVDLVLLQPFRQLDHFLLDNVEFNFDRRHCLLAQQPLKVVLRWHFDDEDDFFGNQLEV
jgi:hypothetical protein